MDQPLWYRHNYTQIPLGMTAPLYCSSRGAVQLWVWSSLISFQDFEGPAKVFWPWMPAQTTFEWGVSQAALTLILLQKYRDTNGRRIVIQIGGVYTTFCQEEGILLQKYRDRNGRCIAILFQSIGGQGSIRLSWIPCPRNIRPQTLGVVSPHLPGEIF